MYILGEPASMFIGSSSSDLLFAKAQSGRGPAHGVAMRYVSMGVSHSNGGCDAVYEGMTAVAHSQPFDAHARRQWHALHWHGLRLWEGQKTGWARWGFTPRLGASILFASFAAFR
jgi:hypothetical protein